jgi:hypothetical protein
LGKTFGGQNPSIFSPDGYNELSAS